MSGNNAVWAVSRSGGGSGHRGQERLDGRRPSTFPSEPGGQIRPSVSGRYVVWEDTRDGNSDIYGFDLAKPQAGNFPVAVGPEDQTRPSVSGRDVVWEDNRNGNRDVYSFNLTTRRRTPGHDGPRRPALPGRRPRHGRLGGARRHRLGRRRQGPHHRRAETTVAPRRPHWQDSPAVGGDMVLWREERNPGELRRVRLRPRPRRGTSVPSAKAPADQFAPSINGRVAAWADDSGGNADIHGKDFSTGETFAVAQGPAPAGEPGGERGPGRLGGPAHRRRRFRHLRRVRRASWTWRPRRRPA